MAVEALQPVILVNVFLISAMITITEASDIFEPLGYSMKTKSRRASKAFQLEKRLATRMQMTAFTLDDSDKEEGTSGKTTFYLYFFFIFHY